MKKVNRLFPTISVDLNFTEDFVDHVCTNEKRKSSVQDHQHKDVKKLLKELVGQFHNRRVEREQDQNLILEGTPFSIDKISDMQLK